MKNLFAIIISLILVSFSTNAQVSQTVNQDSINYVDTFHLPWWNDDGDDYPTPKPPRKGPWGSYPTPYYNL